jgi:hypothetical protein
MYFRRTTHIYPVVTTVGPEGVPVSTSSYVQIKFICEEFS